MKNGLKVVEPLLDSISKSCLYIGSSLSREQKWKVTLNQTRLNTKKIKNVELDVKTRWNSTYLMLENALQVQEGFEHLAELDIEYKSLPTKEEC